MTTSVKIEDLEFGKIIEVCRDSTNGAITFCIGDSSAFETDYECINITKDEAMHIIDFLKRVTKF